MATENLTLIPEEIDRILRQHISEALQESDQRRAARGFLPVEDRESEADAIDALRSELADGYKHFDDVSPIERTADALIARYGLPITKGTDQYWSFCRRVMEAELERLQAEREHMDRFYGPILKRTSPSRQQRAKGASADADDSPPVSEIFKAWVAERKPPKRTAGEWERAVRLWQELHGDSRVGTITVKQVSQYKDALLAMPTHLTAELRALPLPALIEATKNRTDLPKASPATVNKNVAAFRSILGYAKRNGHIEHNPASGVAAIEPRKAEDEERRPFSPSELKAVLEAARKETRDPDRWLPWLAAYTGARLSEIGTARVEDLKEEEGITYIRLTDAGEGRSIKNKGSRRNVPLHPVLIREGFLEYVRSVPRDGMIFPGFKAPAYSKRFARLLDRLGLTDPALVFHGFRHGFKDACRAAGISEEVHDALTGHAGGGVGRDYGRGVPLKVLNDSIHKIRYSESP